ncbi:pyruvate dehydrogenase (acetyl-transferring) E1 component subunit alpha [Lysinibacillus sp. LZ02]|uniref:pyruvate dehydrogenase (acetyl-transferring) E1 component subunit alpha n=1 Tax=Lysinibacillus sp. LZ02 TaxID=3420668 RepID=UPI003D368A27
MKEDASISEEFLKKTVTDEQCVDMYKHMLRARTFDDIALKYQRQGKIGTYAPIRGQEAAQVGSTFALTQKDWIYPSYREIASMLVHGMPMKQFFCYVMGKMAGMHLKDIPIFPIQIIIGAQLLHAVGGAWASKYKDEDSVSVAYMGDGGTSEGDFHEALNFAGVYKLPVIFFIQNNQWAISVPIEKQTASRSIAQKALAYGITGIQVDGNDVLAVFEVMKLAVEKAKKGEPVLVEAITYRQGPHTTADDPTKYREKDEVEQWLKNDPIIRMKKLLLSRNLWSEEQEEAFLKECEQSVMQAYAEALATEKTTVEKAIAATYATLPTNLRRQLEERGAL